MASFCNWFSGSRTIFFGGGESHRNLTLRDGCDGEELRTINIKVGELGEWVVGLAMILYSLWLIRAWQKSIGYLPFEDSDYPTTPRFIYIFLGLGVTLCVITCSEHIAADTANGCCLYLGLTFLLAMILKAFGPHHDYDSDDDYVPERVSLLNHPPPYVIGDPIYGSDAWHTMINKKTNR